MSGRNLASYCPVPAPQHGADDGFLDYDRYRPDTEVWRYARHLVAGAQQQRRQRQRFAELTRAVRRTMVLVGVALGGMAAGMYVGASDALPLDPGTWQQAIARVSLWDRIRPAAAPTLIAGARLASTARAVPEDSAPPPPTLPVEITLNPTARSAPPDRLRAEPALHAGITLAMSAQVAPAAAALPARATAAGVPALARNAGRSALANVAPAPPGGPAGSYRVQLALLRNPRHAEPVWRSFMREVGPRAAGLERFLETTRTEHGLRHLVQTGPFADAAAAEAVCRRVIAAGGDCLVVPPPS